MTAKSEVSPGALGRQWSLSWRTEEFSNLEEDQGRLPGGGSTKDDCYMMNKTYTDEIKTVVGRQWKGISGSRKSLG